MRRSRYNPLLVIKHGDVFVWPYVGSSSPATSWSPNDFKEGDWLGDLGNYKYVFALKPDTKLCYIWYKRTSKLYEGENNSSVGIWDMHNYGYA